MSSVDTRNIERESLFLFAEVQFEGQLAPVRVKIRNLSAGGMMAESGRVVTPGERLTINLRNVGDLPATVAWVEGSRFGIAFDQEIDPASVRQLAVSGESDAPRYSRPSSLRGTYRSDEFKLRRL